MKRGLVYALLLALIIAPACVRSAPAVGNGNNPGGASGNGSGGPGAPVATPTPLGHSPIKIYSGCTGEFIVEYNPENAGAGVGRKNADNFETTSSAAQQTTDCTAASQTTNQNTCPVSQTPAAGEFACVPEFYFTMTKSGVSPCNNSNFYANFNNSGGAGYTAAAWYHSTTPHTFANDSNDGSTGCGGSTPNHIVIPNGSAFINYLTTSGSSPLAGLNTNAYGFLDDNYLCYNTGDCPGGKNIGMSRFLGSATTVDECANQACILTAEGAGTDALAPRGIDRNSWGGAGLGFSDLNSTNIALFTTYQHASNDRLATSEQCLSDGPQGTNKIGGCIAMLNTASATFAGAIERGVFLNNNTPSASGLLPLIRDETALLWFCISMEQPYGYSAANRCVSWWDQGTLPISTTSSTTVTSGTSTPITVASAQDIQNNVPLQIDTGGNLERMVVTVSGTTLTPTTTWAHSHSGTYNVKGSGGGVSADDCDCWNEEYIWPNPFSGQYLPTSQTYIRPFSNTGGSYTTSGDGCGTTTGDVGGMGDALMPGSNFVDATTCLSSSNSKPAGDYGIGFANVYYQFTTGGQNIAMGQCVIFWNPTTSSRTINSNPGWLPFTPAFQVQHNGYEMKNAIGIAAPVVLGCTNCTGTIQEVAFSYPITIAPEDASPILCKTQTIPSPI